MECVGLFRAILLMTFEPIYNVRDLYIHKKSAFWGISPRAHIVLNLNTIQYCLAIPFLSLL